jgi:hypothetical protein
MKITLDYRHPTPSHCDIAVFVNGALTGQLRLRQEEVNAFARIVLDGCLRNLDLFTEKGDPTPPANPGSKVEP